ncbi:unnamed protein product [Urochloa humidicola]
MSSLPMPPPSRSASRFVAKPARGFQVLRIDGYSCTKELPGGERVTSEVFAVGGRHWCVDYYPNGADASSDESDAIALYLRLVGTARTPSYGGVYNYHQMKVRVRAQYKFSLLDLATGDATYELPEKTDIFTISSVFQPAYVAGGSGLVVAGGSNDVGCGYAAFVTRQELEGLIREDRLAIRCDVGVTEVAPPLPVVTPGRNTYSSYLTGFNDYNQQPPPADDKEYIRRCLADDDQINQETVVYHPASYTSGNNCNKY